MSRRKGAQGERDAAKVFRENGWPDADRAGEMQAGDKREKWPDLIGTGLLRVEVKRHERVPVSRIAAEVLAEEHPGFEGVLAHRDNHGPWLGTMKLDRLAVLAAAHRDNLAIVARLKAAFPEVYEALTAPVLPLELDTIVHQTKAPESRRCRYGAAVCTHHQCQEAAA